MAACAGAASSWTRSGSGVAPITSTRAVAALTTDVLVLCPFATSWRALVTTTRWAKGPTLLTLTELSN